MLLSAGSEITIIILLNMHNGIIPYVCGLWAMKRSDSYSTSEYRFESRLKIFFHKSS